MTSKNGSNGKATLEAATVQKNPETEKSETKVGEQGLLNGNVPGVQTPLSIEEKITKLQSLVDLVENRDKFRTHLYQVEALKFGDLDEKAIITISADNGKQTYNIRSSYLCHKIADLLKSEFKSKVAEIETQINF